MSSEAKSFLCLSITTFLGGFPGIGTKGSITLEVTLRTYLWINISYTLSFLRVISLVDLRVSEVTFSKDLSLWVKLVQTSFNKLFLSFNSFKVR